jgi:hypothetical protein
LAESQCTCITVPPAPAAPVPISAAPAGVAGASSSPPAGAYPDTDAARFFINLAVCNTVIPQILEDGRFVYQVGGWGVGGGRRSHVAARCHASSTYSIETEHFVVMVP